MTTEEQISEINADIAASLKEVDERMVKIINHKIQIDLLEQLNEMDAKIVKANRTQLRYLNTLTKC